MGLHFQQSCQNGVAYFWDFGVRIFWQAGSLGIDKQRTICGTKKESEVRVLYSF